MINFFATWCGPCREELPELQKQVWEKYRENKKFALIVIGREHSQQEVADFKREAGFTMPFAPDPERQVYKLFATEFIPRTYVIDAEGKIAFQGMGWTPERFAEMTKTIDRLMKSGPRDSSKKLDEKAR